MNNAFIHIYSFIVMPDTIFYMSISFVYVGHIPRSGIARS